MYSIIMTHPHEYIIALGSNIPTTSGSSLEVLRSTINSISIDSSGRVKSSSIYRTPAYPPGSGPPFANAVIQATLPLAPTECMQYLHDLEVAAGRIRNVRWEPRVLDLDIIACGNLISPDRPTYETWKNLSPDAQSTTAPGSLILPHPRVQDRAFVLVPLRDVVPAWVHPVSGQTVDEMIAALPEEDCADIIPLVGEE